MHRMIRTGLGLMAVTLAVAGCNSSSSNPTAEGIWTGTDDTNGLLLTGYVDSNGAADFIRADGAQFIGQAQVSGNSVTFALQAVSEFGSTFGSSGPTYGSATFNATLDTAESMAGTLSFTPNGGTASSAQWEMNYYLVYENASSLSLISGNYGDAAPVIADGVDPLVGASVSISTAGQMTGQNPNNDCVLNGTVTVIDSSHDLYQVSYTLASCVDTSTGNYAALNGVTFSGMTDYDPTYNPILVTMAVTGEDLSGNHYGIVSQLSAN